MDTTEKLELGRRYQKEIDELEFSEEWLELEDEILLMTGYDDNDVMVEFYVRVKEWEIDVEWIFDTPHGNAELENPTGFYTASNPGDLGDILREVISSWQNEEY